MLSILIEYEELREEIKDIRRRIQKLEKDISKLSEVSDSVKGTRKDGIIGNIKITGYPEPEYYKKKNLINHHKKMLDAKEIELLELTIKAEEYIMGMKSSELRSMFRFYYLDNLTWVQVAHRMNNMFPKRKIQYTDDNCRKRNERYFEKIYKCPAMSG